MLMTLSLLFGVAACGTDDAPAANDDSNSGSEEVTEGVKNVEITFLQNKPEIDQELKDIAAIYSEQSGNTVNIKSCGGDACNLGTQLKADFAAGEAPDVFVIDGASSYDEWKDYILPLNSEAWAQDTAVAYISPDGDTVGFPVAVEGWGMGYNVELLEQAGIDPTTLVNYAAYEEAFAKIDSMKDELGIKAAVSMAASTGMEWVTRDHNLNTYLSAGLEYGDLSVTNEAASGMLDVDRFTEYANWVNLLFDYADPQVLITGNYDDQVGAFANGETVFIHQGNWIEPNLEKAGSTFERAYAPHGAFSTDTDGIFVSAPSWYVVNSDSDADKQAVAKDFLNFLATTDEGHDYFVNKIGAIPAFQSVSITPTAPLSASVMEWSSEGKIYSWNQYYLPEEFRVILGPYYGQLAADEITVDEFVELMQAEFETLK